MCMRKNASGVTFFILHNVGSSREHGMITPKQLSMLDSELVWETTVVRVKIEFRNSFLQEPFPIFKIAMPSL